MKRILVTGGAGFIGSHLCRKLLDAGDEVVCMDNFYTGRRENIAELRADKHFSFIEHDVTEPYTANADEIYNLACPASPVWYQKEPVKTFMTNILGAKNALDAARQCGAKLLLSSTSEVYGDAKESPQKETYWGNVNPVGIRACYDEGKRGAETLFFDYHRQYGMDIKVARIFNTYGERMAHNDGRVVSNFIVQALCGEPITVYGDGSQTRSFCYASDTVDALVRLMAADKSETGPVNIGNPVEITIRELAERIIALTESRSQIIEKPLPADDPKRRRPCIEKAKALLCWKPLVTLEEGLRRTITYFQGTI